MIRLWKYETRSVPLLTRGQDYKGWRSQFRSGAKEWRRFDAGTLKSLIFAKQKATHIFFVGNENSPQQSPTTKLELQGNFCLRSWFCNFYIFAFFRIVDVTVWNAWKFYITGFYKFIDVCFWL